MGDNTGISWTDATWNPLRGCTRVSAGCQHCYAETVAGRFGGAGLPYEGLTKLVGGERRWSGEVRLVENMLDQPLRWKRPRRIFVNSMSDLFHENVPDEWIDRIFAVMALAPQHTFQVLTKRPARMASYLNDPEMRDGLKSRLTIKDNPGKNRLTWPLPNVWLGVSVENQATADERIPLLRDTPAAKRFISAEPLLGPVDLSGGIDWVICGGESGPHARPMHPHWARSLMAQCRSAGVAFFMKQMGGATKVARDAIPSDLQVQEFPDAAR